MLVIEITISNTDVNRIIIIGLYKFKALLNHFMNRIIPSSLTTETTINRSMFDDFYNDYISNSYIEEAISKRVIDIQNDNLALFSKAIENLTDQVYQSTLDNNKEVIEIINEYSKKEFRFVILNMDSEPDVLNMLIGVIPNGFNN